ncbi:MAG: hypothetical protein JWR69_117 [Pedosphaera sp.]|nr:hypothetical protein [Pedosphaera sp.]
MKLLDLGPDQLANWRKGDARKVRLARLRAETTMTLDWIADHLHMGTAANVALCLRRAGKTK